MNSTTLYVNCFGTPQLVRNQTQLTPRLGSKALALFLYLAVTGRPHSRDLLADLFWGEQSTQGARNNLRYGLPELRKTVGDYLLITPHTIAFDRSQPYELDCERFRHTLTLPLDKRPTADLQATLGLYHSEFLAGFHIRNAPLFEEWVIQQQEELRMLAVNGLHHLAERYYSTGNFTEGLAISQRLLGLEPWHEAGHRLQMNLLVQQGQRNAALTHYQRLRQLLADELATEPEAETQQLYATISHGRFPSSTPYRPEPPPIVAVATQVALPSNAPAPGALPTDRQATAWADKHNLSAQLTPFFGREQEIADLYAHLHQDDYRLITLTGEGGIGKTRLALAVAQAILNVAAATPVNAESPTTHQKFADGIWFVPLRGLHVSLDLTEELTIAIAQAMNFSFSDTRALPTQLFAYLRNKKALLILDNFEQFHTGAEFILELLRKTAGIRLLITSRARLNLQAEYQWAVAGLPTPSCDQASSASVAEICQYSSITLFVERARRAQRDFQLDATNQRAVCYICRTLHGLPLGIELAAAQLRFCSCDAIGQTLATDVLTLATSYRDVPEHHRSLFIVLEDSWRLLNGDEQAVLARLAIFQGSFTTEAATVVAAAEPALLEALCDKSLLQPNGFQRYLLHDFVRQFAIEKLKQGKIGGESTIAARHADYYLALLRAQEAVFYGPTPQAAIALIHQELVNIEHAWHWAVAQGASSLLAQSCQSWSEFYYYTYLLEKGKQTFAAAIAMTQQQLTAAGPGTVANTLETSLAALLCAQSHLWIAQKAYETASTVAQQAVALARKQNVPALVAKGIYLWGVGLSSLGEYGHAEQQLTVALDLARTTKQQDLVISTLVRLANLAEYQAYYPLTQEYCAEALALSRTTNNLMGESRTLNKLGSLYQRLGDFAQAKSCWETALALLEQSGIAANKAELLTNLGVLCDNLGNYAAAQRYYQTALRLSRDNGVRHMEAEVLGNLGISADYVGDYAAALTYSQSCLQVLQQLDIAGRMPIVLVNLGLHAHHLGEHKAAQSYGRQALALSQQIDNRHLQSYAWTILGHAATALEEFADAVAAYTEAIMLARTLALPLMTIEPLAGLVRVGLAQEKAFPIIQPYLEEILSFLIEHSSDGLEEPFRVYLTCYQGLQAMADLRAVPLLKTAYALLQKQVAQIDSPLLQRSFLENVAANQALQSAAQAANLTQR